MDQAKQDLPGFTRIQFLSTVIFTNSYPNLFSHVWKLLTPLYKWFDATLIQPFTSGLVLEKLSESVFLNLHLKFEFYESLETI